MERKVINLIGEVLITPYNFSLVMMTALWWILCYYSPYNGTGNFDMIVTMTNYVIYLNLIAIAVGLSIASNHCKYLARLGAVGFALSILALAATKSYVAHRFGAFIATPASQFCFLLLLKNIWISSSGSIDSQENDE